MAISDSKCRCHIRVTAYHYALIVYFLATSQANARTVRVGGSAGWTNYNPSTEQVPDYSGWANSQSISVNDTLQFFFETGVHSLYQLLSQADLDSCNFTGAIMIFGRNSSSPVNVTLKAGLNYFACASVTDSGLTHCQQGQKFEVTVQSSESTSPSITPPASPSSSGQSSVVAGVVISLVLLLAVGLTVYFCYQRRRRNEYVSSLRKRKSKSNLKDVMSTISQGKGSVYVFTFKELEKATENFGEHLILGIGGFGTVYKGTLRNGTVHVAIKISNHSSTSGKKQLMNEISILSQTSHPNLVKLFGCCLETEVPILVYEYIPNGNLYEHLHRLRFGVNLNWTKRLQIATETAEALAYLHFAAVPPIYHRDVKSANILLDNTFTVKVADFGISRLTNPEKTHVSTAVQGTPGYLDPEYFHSYHLTDKSDVYSFGVVLLELITSQKPLDYKRGDEHSLAPYVVPFVREGRLEEIVDPQLKQPVAQFMESLSTIQCVAELAVDCLADKRKDRPTMKDVVEDLQNIKLYGRRIGVGRNV